MKIFDRRMGKYIADHFREKTDKELVRDIQRIFKKVVSEAQVQRFRNNNRLSKYAGIEHATAQRITQLGNTTIHRCL